MQLQRVGGPEVLHRVTGLVRTVEPQDVLGSVERSATSGTVELHAGGQFVAGDARRQFRITREPLEWRSFSRWRKSRVAASFSRRDRRGAGQVADRVGGVEVRALKCGREGSRAPIVDAVLGFASRIRDGDIGRQILVLLPRAYVTQAPMLGKPSRV